MGETLRRVVGKACLGTSVSKDEIASLTPLQVGVGVQGAADAAAIATQSIVNRLSGHWAILKIDIRNAFNTVSRHAVFKEASTRCPSI